MKNVNLILVTLLVGLTSTLTFTSCQQEGCTDPMANNYDPDAKKDNGLCLYPHIVPSVIQEGVYYLTGNGGSVSETHTLNNIETTAEYEINISEGDAGSVQVVIMDNNGDVVADETLTVGEGNESSDCTLVGAPGSWSVTITLTGFAGEASIIVIDGC